MSRQLTIVLPGMWGPPGLAQADPTVAPSLSAVGRWLTRAEVDAWGSGELVDSLFRFFAVPAPAGDWPAAAVTWYWDSGEVGTDFWLRADPVHLRADRDRVLMLQAADLDLYPDEVEELVGAVNGLLVEDGWALLAPAAERWYLAPTPIPDIRTDPPSSVLAQDIHPHLPSGPDGGHWRGLLNELQMLLHTNEANSRRQARGAPAVNSLWFWGGGRLPRLSAPGWSHVWAHDALALGLARLSGAAGQAPPASASDWLASASPGQHLIVLEGVWASTQLGDVETWSSFMEHFETHWAAPLLAALKRGEVDTLELLPGDGRRFRLGRRERRRWWRRSRPWLNHAPEAGG